MPPRKREMIGREERPDAPSPPDRQMEREIQRRRLNPAGVRPPQPVPSPLSSAPASPIPAYQQFFMGAVPLQAPAPRTPPPYMSMARGVEIRRAQMEAQARALQAMRPSNPSDIQLDWGISRRQPAPQQPPAPALPQTPSPLQLPQAQVQQPFQQVQQTPTGVADLMMGLDLEDTPSTPQQFAFGSGLKRGIRYTGYKK